MANAIPKDWASGISAQLRDLIANGADNQELERFIHARKFGDSALVNQVVESRGASTCAMPISDLGEELDIVVQRLRVEALKPLVDKMSAEALQDYVQWVWHLSEQVVRMHRHEPFWSNETVVTAVAGVVIKYSLSRQTAAAPSCVHGESASKSRSSL